MVPAKWVYMQSFFYQIGITSRDETGLSFGLCYPMVMSPDTVALCFPALNGYTADADTVLLIFSSMTNCLSPSKRLISCPSDVVCGSLERL